MESGAQINDTNIADQDLDLNDLVQSSVHNLREIRPAAELREHENSVDCISANPVNQNEFVTGSHDKTIKVWDLSKQKSVKTMVGHKEGVWCINYNKDGTQLVTASPEGIAKLWDIKSAKSTADLRGHTKRVFWATYNNANTQIATCGSDKLVLLWDLRKTSEPVSQNNQNESIILCCDFFPDDKFICTTNLEGDVNLISLQDNMSIVRHETIEGHMKTNTAYCCTTVKNSQSQEGVFLVGSENKLITKFQLDKRDYTLEKLGSYHGHSNSVRNVQVSKDCRQVLSCCEDHSLRIWDYQTFAPQIILTGHRDNVSGAAYINENTIVSSSWDLRVMVWKI